MMRTTKPRGTMSEEYQSHFELPPFIPIFIGLDEHLRLGKMSLAEAPVVVGGGRGVAINMLFGAVVATGAGTVLDTVTDDVFVLVP